LGSTRWGEELVRIITESRLTAFWTEHPPAEIPLKAWRALMRLARYESPHQVKADFPATDFLGSRVTVFDIGGNRYRLVVTMRYDLQRVYIRHVLTHAEYDRRTRAGDL
jgi:mRNA interferase HigB